MLPEESQMTSDLRGIKPGFRGGNLQYAGMLYCFRMDIEQNQEAYLNASRAITNHLSFREDGGAARGA